MRKLILLPILFVFLPFAAWANLGDNDKVVAMTAKKVFPSYNRMESTAGRSKVIQFSTTKDSKIFALRWTGTFTPDIQALLGSYATDFAAFNQAHPTGERRIPYRKITAGRIILELWDMPKIRKGRAYVPAIMPSDVTPDDIN